MSKHTLIVVILQVDYYLIFLLNPLITPIFLPQIQQPKLDSIARALNTTTPDIVNNAYRVKKIKPENPINNNPIFIQKVTNELRKLPTVKAERICKSLIVLLKEMDQNK